MKAVQIFLLASVFGLFSVSAVAQTKKTSFDVSGNCGMCKKTIEKAAKDAGASFAEWDSETKKITVKFNRNTNVSKIQQKIADSGYDNAGVQATDEAYNKLHGCCKYERASKKDSQ